MVGGVPAVDADPPGEPSPGEPRHQPVDCAEQGGLAAAGAAHHQGEIALRHAETDVVQDPPVLTGVTHRQLVDVDHATTPPRKRARWTSADCPKAGTSRSSRTPASSRTGAGVPTAGSTVKQATITISPSKGTASD